MATRPGTIEEFTDRVKELFALDAAKTRFILKYKHTDGNMSLRATNDELCIIYKTDQASEMRRAEALQLWLIAAMCDVEVDALPEQAEGEADLPRQGAPSDKQRRGKKSKRGRQV
ncbi:hypothetical protein M885DRAFT_547741 [Pelagophyceae sp. CCMP2097]|nr:hypothetical protein M885DRAFT_547741 [Pelagophyceae sp. CCMP2097]|mmetsp:Transcript_2535/g.9245  ORF Transcript_2535/g.9245 Transcript_2535/m.9245 type:complete len:115 (+) Transcript_2535:124-468(+)